MTVEATKPNTTSSEPGGTRITTSDEEAVPPNAGMRLTNWGANYIDERTGISGLVRELGRKIFPDHWSFMLGEVALYSFVVILLSGTFLTFFFQASMAEVVYEGSYLPLKGLDMSAAMASTLDISFDIRGGLLMRQVHHWAALLFVASIGLHMLRVFFTGAFRKPRELNWIVGFVLFILAMAEGFTGYSLPDDLLSGNGLRIIDGMVKGIPIVGTWISYLLFGGEFPGTQVVGMFYSLHILLLPAIIVALIGVHMVLLVVNKHTQFSGPGRTNDNVVGVPIMPVFAAKAGGFFFIIFGVITLVAATVTINPIWVYGPYDPSPVSAGTQPDWYIGFADGALRLVPPGWELELFGFTLSLNILVPLLVLPLFLAVVALYPFLEGWITGDQREHHMTRPPAQRSEAHRDRRRRRHVLRGPVGRRRIRPHRHPLQAVDRGRDPRHPGPALRRPGRGVHRRPPHLHRPAEEGSRDRAARLRVRAHRPPPRRRVHRGARAAVRLRALEARRLRRLQAAHAASEQARPHPDHAACALGALELVLRGPHRTGHQERDRSGPAARAPLAAWRRHGQKPSFEPVEAMPCGVRRTGACTRHSRGSRAGRRTRRHAGWRP